MKQSLFIFGYLTDGDIEWLVSIAERVEFDRDRPLIRQGEVSNTLYILLDGAVEVSTASRAWATVSTGDILGELSLFDSRPPSATVRALEPTSALAIPFAILRERLRVDPELASRLYFGLGVLMSQRMREMLGEQGADEFDTELMEQVTIAGRRFEILRDRARAME